MVDGLVPINAPGGSGSVDFESLDGMPIAAEGMSNADGDFMLELPPGTYTPFVFFRGVYSGRCLISDRHVCSVHVEPGEYATADFDSHALPPR